MYLCSHDLFDTCLSQLNCTDCRLTCWQHEIILILVNLARVEAGEAFFIVKLGTSIIILVTSVSYKALHILICREEAQINWQII